MNYYVSFSFFGSKTKTEEAEVKRKSRSKRKKKQGLVKKGGVIYEKFTPEKDALSGALKDKKKKEEEQAKLLLPQGNVDKDSQTQEPLKRFYENFPGGDGQYKVAFSMFGYNGILDQEKVFAYGDSLKKAAGDADTEETDSKPGQRDHIIPQDRMAVLEQMVDYINGKITGSIMGERICISLCINILYFIVVNMLPETWNMQIMGEHGIFDYPLLQVVLISLGDIFLTFLVSVVVGPILNIMLRMIGFNLWTKRPLIPYRTYRERKHFVVIKDINDFQDIFDYDVTSSIAMPFSHNLFSFKFGMLRSFGLSILGGIFLVLNKLLHMWIESLEEESMSGFGGILKTIYHNIFLHGLFVQSVYLLIISIILLDIKYAMVSYRIRQKLIIFFTTVSEEHNKHSHVNPHLAPLEEFSEVFNAKTSLALTSKRLFGRK